MKRLCLVVLAFSTLSFLGTTASATEDHFSTGSGRDGALTAAGLTFVNEYAAVASAMLGAGATIVDVDDATGFAAGDLALIVQAQDDTMLGSGAHPAGIDLATMSAGLYEFARIATVTGTTIAFQTPLQNAFDAAHTQVVRVPEYTDVTVPIGAAIAASPWDGESGGIVAFLATGTVTNDGFVAASRAGFRGGISLITAPGRNNCVDPDEPAPDGQPRGEGIDASLWGTTGFANALNGGGGGVCHNAGGGGGGNGGIGGRGGRSWEGDGSREVGGLGGDVLLFSALDRFTFGGGGGAGHGNNGSSTDGGRGGGVVFVRAGSIAGSGVFAAAGANAGNSNNDGAGGGGAGGVIVLRAVGAVDCGAAIATGGHGGDAAGDEHGPGGGGAGGRVLIQGASGTCEADIGHGRAGVQPDKDAPGGRSYGAGPEPGSMSAAGVEEAPPADPVVVDEDGDGLRDVFESPLDTDGDGDADFRDDDDDGDAIPTADELADPDADGDPADAIDSDSDGVPDYLDADPVPVAEVTIASPADGEVVSDGTPTFSGTATPGKDVTIVIDGGSPVTVTADASGAWSYVPPMSLADGPHEVEVSVSFGAQTATDTASFSIATVVDPCASCTDEQICVAGTCFAVCLEDADCEAPELCYAGRCAMDPCESVVCGAEEVCAGGTCFPVCDDTGDCSNPDHVCYDGRCTDEACTGISCGASQTCWGGSCFDTCGSDVDCTNPSERCYETRCTDDACRGVACGVGQVCWGGSCFDACEGDVDCTNPNERCYEGRCTDEACRGVQCASAQVCWGGSCFDSCGADVDCSDTSDTCYETRCATDPCEGVQCPSEQLCVQGYCRTDCDTDADCGDGESCVLGLCGTKGDEEPGGPAATPAVPDEGCGCSSAGNGLAHAWLALLTLAFVGWRRRRKTI